MLKMYRTIISAFQTWKGKNMYPRLSTGAAYRSLPADACKGENRLPAVLIVPGWNSNGLYPSSAYTKLAEALNTLGYHTLQLSLQGHEGAHGDIASVTREDHAKDIRAAVAWLKRNPYVDSSRISAFGTSYGAYMLAALAGEFDFKLLAMRAPALYRNDGWLELTAQAVDAPDRVEWRRTVHTAADSAAIAGIAGFKGHLLLVASELDEDMPPQVAESYLGSARTAASITHEELEGAPHALFRPQDKEKFLEIAKEWFEKYYPTSHAPA